LFTEAPSLKPLIMWGPKLQFVWLIHKSGPLMKIHWRHCDIIIAGVISNAMHCPAYSIMNTVWHTVQFLQVRTEGVWQKILQNLGQCGCPWSLKLGGSMKPGCGRLGQTFVNFYVSHGTWALCSLWSTMKSCVTLCHHLKQEHYYYRKCVFVILCKGTFEMAFVWLVVGYMYNLETFCGRYYSFIAHCEVALPFVWLILVSNITYCLERVWGLWQYCSNCRQNCDVTVLQ